MGARIALPLMSFISFVGGSLESIFIAEVGVMHAGMLVKIGDDDFFVSCL